jgi:outer membrane protein OmpA-like peptidoglycan-associated protein
MPMNLRLRLVPLFLFRLGSKGLGETVPVADNSTPEGKQ